MDALEWVSRQWNEPSKDNWYLMQQTAVIQNLLLEEQDRVKPEDYKIPFKYSGDPVEKLTSEEADMASDQMAMFLAGGSSVMVVEEKDLAALQESI